MNDAMAEEFEKEEHALFGEDGFEKWLLVCPLNRNWVSTTSTNLHRNEADRSY